MRKELSFLETIDRYLDGKLDPDQKREFEKKLANDKEFYKKVEDQIELRKGLERLGLKADIKKAHKKYGKSNGFGKGLMISIGIIAIASALIFSDVFTQNEEVTEVVETLVLKESNNPEEYLDAQVFHLDLEKTEIIETEYMLLSIPDDAFIDADGNVITEPVQLVVREAFDPLSIMKAGLETFSDGRQLESGGMFHIAATSNGKEVFANPNSPIIADVELDKPLEDIQIWDGENDGQGNINWTNPKKPENFLIPVDILKLDFYPDGFIQSLNKQGKNVEDKGLTDSVYYSLVEKQLEEEPVLESEISFVRGVSLFKSNCSSCHLMSEKKSTGPGLKGVMDRVPNVEWLLAWIRNNRKLIEQGDSYANTIFNEHNQAAMPLFEFLSPDEISSIVLYLKLAYEEPIKSEPYSLDSTDVFTTETTVVRESNMHWTPPSTIQSIWNKKFQNTLLSTNEFQKRLKSLHTHGSKEMIEVYVNNLDKDMYYSDSIVYTMLENRDAKIPTAFKNYLKEKAGKVKGTNLKAIKKLADYYKRTQIIKENAAIAARKKIEKEIKDLRKKYTTQKEIRRERDRIIKNLNYRKEYEHNLKDVCKQLGIKKIRQGTPNSTRFIVDGFGFKNIDRIVVEATTNRETTVIKDTFTGKTAEIIYTTQNVKVKNDTLFDRIVPYMIPEGLYSFQKMKRKNSLYTEKLNGSLNYKIVFLGFKGDEVYMSNERVVVDRRKQLPDLEFELQKTSQKEINKLFRFGQRNVLRDIKKDVAYQKLEMEYQAKNKAFQDKERERLEILRAISKHEGAFFASDYKVCLYCDTAQ